MYLSGARHLVTLGVAAGATIVGETLLKSKDGGTEDSAAVDAHVVATHGEGTKRWHVLFHAVVGGQKVAVWAEFAQQIEDGKHRGLWQFAGALQIHDGDDELGDRHSCIGEARMGERC